MDSANLRATSQHYGLKTMLLDFTTDPMVAIRFALDLGGECEEPCRAVWFRDVTTIATARSRFVLPPPFLRRLHAQRGFLVECDRDSATALRRKCFRLVFDWHRESTGHFQPVWLSEKYETYPHTQWLERAVDEVERERIDWADARASIRDRLLRYASRELAGTPNSGEESWTEETHANLLYDALYCRPPRVADRLVGLPVLQHGAERGWNTI